MSQTIPVLAFIAVLALMVWLLLDPSSLLGLMRSAIPPEARPAPPRYPHFPVIVIFAIGVGLFHVLRSSTSIHVPQSRGAFELCSMVLAAAFLGANGIWACYWPISFQRVYIPQLRCVEELDLSPKAAHRLAILGKSWGVVFLLACSFVVYSLNAR